MAGESSRVGPHGYIHGWIFVGAPGVGARVFHPQHGHGTVTSHEGKHAAVKFDKGSEHHFEVTPGGKPATLRPRGGGTSSWMHETRGEWIVGGRVSTYRGPAVSEGDRIKRPDGRYGHVRNIDTAEDGHQTITVDRGNPYSQLETYNYSPGTTGQRLAGSGDFTAAAESLNRGGELPGTAEGRLVEAGIGNWVYSTPARDAATADADAALARAVEGAPRSSPVLYRGLAGWPGDTPALDQLAGASPGYRFRTGMASFTDSEEISRAFARDIPAPEGVSGVIPSQGAGETHVMLTLESGAQALNIQRYAGRYRNQKEWISGGHFEVTGSSHPSPGLILLRVRQVTDDR